MLVSVPLHNTPAIAFPRSTALLNPENQHFPSYAGLKDEMGCVSERKNLQSYWPCLWCKHDNNTKAPQDTTWLFASLSLVGVRAPTWVRGRALRRHERSAHAGALRGFWFPRRDNRRRTLNARNAKCAEHTHARSSFVFSVRETRDEESSSRDGSYLA